MIATLLKDYQLEYRGEENIPSVICDNWQSFSQLVESFNSLEQSQFVFRGQRRKDWELTPGLARFNDRVIPSEPRGIVLEEHASDQIALFRRAIRGRVDDHALFDDEDPREVDELWSIGQHYGLNTPLLDWTHSPYVALYFAFEKDDPTGEADNTHRVVYVLNKPKLESLQGPDGEPAINFVEPRKDDHGRLVSQAGLFTSSPYGKSLENAVLDALAPRLAELTEAEDPSIVAGYLFKIFVKNEGQAQIIKNLRQMNIHPASLFPDLIGAAQNCNKLMSERYSRVAPMAASVSVNETSSAIDSVVVEIIQTIPTSPSPGFWTLQSLSSLVDSLTTNGAVGADYQLLAKEIMAELAPHTAQVDWQNRESAIAKMRNVAKVILRRNNYPEERRETIVNELLIEASDDRRPA
jgi:hypothetical protein